MIKLRPKKPALSAYITLLGPIVYYKLNEPSGATITNYGSLGSAANGTYASITYEQVPAPGATKANFYDGSTSRAGMYTTSLRDNFNGTLGSFLLWQKIESTVASACLINLYVSATYRYMLAQSAGGDGAYLFTGQTGGAAITIPTSILSATWHLFALTWDRAGNALKGYVDGAQVDTTKAGLAAWSGTLSSSYNNIGSYATNSGWNDGYYAHAAVFNKALTATQIKNVYNIGRI